jgi:hypothetical protein
LALENQQLKITLFLLCLFPFLDTDLFVKAIRKVNFSSSYCLSTYKKKFVKTKETIGYISETHEMSANSSKKSKEKTLAINSYLRGDAIKVIIFDPSFEKICKHLEKLYPGVKSVISSYHNKLVWIRRFFSFVHKRSSSTPFQEIAEVHPVARDFLQSFLQDFRSSSIWKTGIQMPDFVVKKAVEDINGKLPTTCNGFLKNVKLTGNTDLLVMKVKDMDEFLLQTPITDSHPFYPSIAHVELKIPFGSLFHSGSYAERDQLLAETKLIAQMKMDTVKEMNGEDSTSEATSTDYPGLLFDLFVCTFGINCPENFICTKRFSDPTKILSLFLFIIVSNLRGDRLTRDFLEKFGDFRVDDEGKDGEDNPEGEDNFVDEGEEGGGDDAEEKEDDNDNGQSKELPLYNRFTGTQRGGSFIYDDGENSDDDADSSDPMSFRESDHETDFDEFYYEDSEMVYPIKDDEQEIRRRGYEFLDYLDNLKLGFYPLKQEYLDQVR